MWGRSTASLGLQPCCNPAAPRRRQAIFCCGKGGNMGGQYMMEAAIELLRQQGHSGERHRIVMVGDRFDTDIRAGLSVGIRTCLVASGCHNIECQQFCALTRTLD